MNNDTPDADAFDPNRLQSAFVDRYPMASERKSGWKHVQDLAQQWRDTGDEQYKVSAADLLFDLMTSETLVILKVLRVDGKLPPRFRRDYHEMAQDVALSVVSHKYSRCSAILENHNPEDATLQTMVARYLRNKAIDHLRIEPLPGSFRQPVKRGGADTASDPRKKSNTLVDDIALDDALLVNMEATPPEPQRASSLLSDAVPGTPSLPPDDHVWDNLGEFMSDLTKIFTPQEQEAVYYDIAGYTNEEAAEALSVSLATYKRRLGRAREKFAQYHSLGE